MAVDDSARVLESLKWIFADEPYCIFTFDNPLEALSLIGATEFPVVVTEHSMRKMDGLEFLKKARERSPNTVGILMSGYTEFKDALNSLYPGCVFRFVKKPLDKNEIMQAMRMAVTQYQINRERGRQIILA